jgi:hypothetical protein
MRNIVIAPCGNKSFLFRESWLKFPDERDFELCLLFYHERIDAPELYKAADHFYHLKGFKYHMLHELLTTVRPDWLRQYDYFYFLDDDIDIDTRGINAIFAMARALDGQIVQAALSRDSFCSWPIFKQKKNSFCRFVGQIEVMAPLFSREALVTCLPSFIGNRSSWGVDSVWSKLLGYPEDRMIIFDRVVMKHTLPVGGGELYQKIGVDPYMEWKAITDQYQARMQNYTEYGRLQLVSKNSNRLNFIRYRAEEYAARVKRGWNDYDLPSRLRSRKNKFLQLLRNKG